MARLPDASLQLISREQRVVKIAFATLVDMFRDNIRHEGKMARRIWRKLYTFYKTKETLAYVRCTLLE